jgi:hypothetical protein
MSDPSGRRSLAGRDVSAAPFASECCKPCQCAAAPTLACGLPAWLAACTAGLCACCSLSCMHGRIIGHRRMPAAQRSGGTQVLIVPWGSYWWPHYFWKVPGPCRASAPERLGGVAPAGLLSLAWLSRVLGCLARGQSLLRSRRPVLVAAGASSDADLQL